MIRNRMKIKHPVAGPIIMESSAMRRHHYLRRGSGREVSANALDEDPSVTFPWAFLPFPLIPDAEGTAPKPDAPSQAEPREEPCVWEQRDPGDREILMDPDTGDGS